MRGEMLVAKTATGRDVCMSLERNPQLLITGSSGSGKSEAAIRLLVEVLKLYRNEELAIIILDPKQITFAQWQRRAYVFDAPADFLRVGQALSNEAERRYLAMKERGKSVFVPTPASPQIFVLIDECPDFFFSTELIKAQRQELQELYIKLSNKARGCGFSLCFASQSPLTDAIPGAIRNNCGNRLIFKLNSPEMAKAATADRIEEANPVLLTMPGEGFFLTDLTAGKYERGRILRVDEAELEDVLEKVPPRPYLFALDFDNPDYRG